MNRTYSFFTLLAVIGVSIVFGMIAGGFLNQPRVMYAAGGHSLVSQSAPVTDDLPMLQPGAGPNFADIAEAASRAVVNVTNTRKRQDSTNPHSQGWLDYWFNRNPDEDQTPEDEGDDEERPRSFRPNRITSGSGFLISDDGYILTNNHVVAEADRLTIRMDDGESFEAVVIGTDPAIDLAVIKIDAGSRTLPYLELNESAALRVGEWVVAIGNPQEFDRSVTVGVVSGLNRRVALPMTDFLVAAFIQTDAAINFGNSGGPLLNTRGRVVGINTAISRGDGAEGIGFALEISQARSAMEQLLARGEVHRGFLGVTMHSQGYIDTTMQEYFGLPDRDGVLLENVGRAGPAGKAGLKKGDVIRTVDGRAIRSNQDLVGLIASRMPGETVELEVFRNGRTLTKVARLVDRDDALEERGLSSARPSPEPPQEEEPSSSSLGIQVETFDPADATERYGRGVDSDLQGVEITGIEFGSQAADKGLRPGLIIVAVNEEKVRGIRDWRRLVLELPPHHPLMIEYTDPSGRLSDTVFLETK